MYDGRPASQNLRQWAPGGRQYSALERLSLYLGYLGRSVVFVIAYPLYLVTLSACVNRMRARESFPAA